MQEIIGYISSVGFPIAVAVYVLVRLEKTLKENTQAINAMLTYVKKH